MGAVLSATFTDPIPAGNTITGLTVQYGIRHACYSVSNAMEFQLNTNTYGTWCSTDGPHCACSNPAVGLATFSPDISFYNEDGDNTLDIVHNYSGTCHEAVTTVPSYPAGTMIVVTIDYGCP